MRMRKSERMIAVFTKELLVTVFVVTVFVEVGRTTLWARSVELFISWNLLLLRVVGGGVPYLKNNAVFGEFQYF